MPNPCPTAPMPDPPDPIIPLQLVSATREQKQAWLATRTMGQLQRIAGQMQLVWKRSDTHEQLV